MGKSRNVRDEIESRVRAAVKAASGTDHCDVIFSAYDEDEDENPINNLDAVALKGAVRLVGFTDEFWGGKRSADYRSEIMTDPTWLHCCVAADAMIRVTRDRHHAFLEGFDKLPEAKQTEPGVTLYEFVMGS